MCYFIYILNISNLLIKVYGGGIGGEGGPGIDGTTNIGDPVDTPAVGTEESEIVSIFIIFCFNQL